MKIMRIGGVGCLIGAIAATTHIINAIGHALTPGVTLSLVALAAGSVGAGLALGYTLKQGRNS